MRGDLVIARAVGNKPIVRRVWDFSPEKVYICTEEKFKSLTREPDEHHPIGFPRQDVFFYDESLWRIVERGYMTDPSVWNNLAQWSDNGEGEREAA